jgi:hypothetical protein
MLLLPPHLFHTLCSSELTKQSTDTCCARRTCCSLSFQDCNLPGLLPAVRQCTALKQLRAWHFPNFVLPVEETSAALVPLLRYAAATATPPPAPCGPCASSMHALFRAELTSPHAAVCWCAESFLA